MAREKLLDRRVSVTAKVRYEGDGGSEIKILITVGFDRMDRPKEVFCADFKAGTQLHGIVMDACILFSRLLQHGDSPVDISASMSNPPSMIGAIAHSVAAFEKE